MNKNPYQLDLFDDNRVHVTFNVIDLIPFSGSTEDEAKNPNLRTNHLQEGGDDGRPSSKGPTTSAMAKQILEKWNLVELNRDKFLSSWAMI